MIVTIFSSIVILLILVKSYCFLFSARCKSKVCLVGKTAVVTGGSSGIGYEIVLDLASRGCRVIIADKNIEPSVKNAIIAETHNSNIELKYVDLESFKSVREFAEDLKKSEQCLDILINNAGIGGSPLYLTDDGMEPILQVNYYSAFLMTHLLVDLLKKSGSARILFTTSMLCHMHRISMARIQLNKLSRGYDWLHYPDSKFCQIVASAMFAEKLKPFGISCNSWHPWVVKTPIFARSFSSTKMFSSKILVGLLQILALAGKTAEEAAQTALHLAHANEVKNVSGEFFGECSVSPKPRGANNWKLCKAIWECSEKAVKLTADEKLE